MSELSNQLEHLVHKAQPHARKASVVVVVLGIISQSVALFLVAVLVAGWLFTLPYWYDHKNQTRMVLRWLRLLVTSPVKAYVALVRAIAGPAISATVAISQRSPGTSLVAQPRVKQPATVPKLRSGPISKLAAWASKPADPAKQRKRDAAKLLTAERKRWQRLAKEYSVKMPALRVTKVRIIDGGYVVSVKLSKTEHGVLPPVSRLLRLWDEIETDYAPDGRHSVDFDVWKGQPGIDITVLAENPLRALYGDLLPSPEALEAWPHIPAAMHHRAPVEIGKDTKGRAVTIPIDPAQDIGFYGMKGRGKGNLVRRLLWMLFARKRTYVFLMDAEKQAGGVHDYEEFMPHFAGYVGAHDLRTPGRGVEFLARVRALVEQLADAEIANRGPVTKTSTYTVVLIIDGEKNLTPDVQDAAAVLSLDYRALGLVMVQVGQVKRREGRTAKAKDASMMTSVAVLMGQSKRDAFQMAIGDEPTSGDLEHLRSYPSGAGVLRAGEDSEPVRFLAYYVGAECAIAMGELARLDPSKKGFNEGFTDGTNPLIGTVPNAQTPWTGATSPLDVPNCISGDLRASNIWQAIASHGPISQADLRSVLGLSRSTAKRALDDLVRQGLIVAETRNGAGHIDYSLPHRKATT